MAATSCACSVSMSEAARADGSTPLTELLARRRSVRAYTDEPVEEAEIQRLLAVAGMAPSGGNVQPWRVWTLTGDTLTRFRERIAELRREQPMGAGDEYPMYPPKLWEPYRTRRFDVGERLYASIGIERSDRDGRIAQFANNYDFFGAPAALLIGIERRMGRPQIMDLGMFIQTFLLAATEAGLATCPQAAWTSWHDAVYEMLDWPDDVMLMCGIAIGHEDTEHPINSWRAPRADVAEWSTAARFASDEG